MKTKIEIGTTFPYSYRNRLVTAEVTGRRKDGHCVLWQVTLTEGGQPVLHDEPNLAGKSVEFDSTTRSLGLILRWRAESSRRFASLNKYPADLSVQWLWISYCNELWVEIREIVWSGPYRPTRWVRSDYANVGELLASGDAMEIPS